MTDATNNTSVGQTEQRPAAQSAPSTGIYSSDPLACPGCAKGCFRCRPIGQSAPPREREAAVEAAYAAVVEGGWSSVKELGIEMFQAGASWQRTQAAGVPEGWKLVKIGDGCVTSSMKAACIGEFSFGITMACGECVDCEADSDCPVCGGEVEYTQRITVPWDTCKEIYKAMLAAAPAPEPASPWISVEDRLPDSGRSVLAFYRNSHDKARRIRAEYIAPKSREADTDYADPETQCIEYSEAEDTYYLLPGWYELIDNWDEYTSIAVFEGEVTHWMPLPAAPEQPAKAPSAIAGQEVKP